MPVPILPQNINNMIDKQNDKNVQVDYGFISFENLSDMMQKHNNSKDLLKVSDNEANLLFKLWKSSGEGFGKISVPKDINNNDILRLKASGLISGDVDEVIFTPRGKDIITTMVLSEDNALVKQSKSKPFSQRLSETKPKKKLSVK